MKEEWVNFVKFAIEELANIEDGVTSCDSLTLPAWDVIESIETAAFRLHRACRIIQDSA